MPTTNATNATSATTATNANNVAVTDTTTAQIPVNGGGELGPRPTPIK